jgi:NAD-dependent deacetylase
MKKVVVLTGAGISAESGLKTFRDAGGLWEGHDINEVATPEAWHNNAELVLKFYNQRRKQLKEVRPNEAHYAIAKMEENFRVSIITQNVDNLHEQAGSSDIIHLHGELTKARSTGNSALIYDWLDDLNIGHICDEGFQLRPHIVWFGEAVPLLEEAVEVIHTADVALIVGTSMQVYPAASLIGFAPSHCITYYVDPNPHLSYELRLNQKLHIVAEKATAGVPKVITQLLSQRY